MKPMISIVTISYNASLEIEKTIRSVLEQTYTDYEYVFIDGASTDETVSIIESYRELFEKKGVQYRVSSEPDKGIYDAMNKGIACAEGEWVIMLNAGDRLLNPGVLRAVFDGKTYDADVVYGNTILQELSRGELYYKRQYAKPLEQMTDGMVFCHQSVFVRGEILRKYKFDTSFKIVADYDQFVRMWKEGIQFTKVETDISLFDGSGVSMAKPEVTLSEHDAVRKKNGIVSKQNKFERLFQWGKYAMRQTVRGCLPGWFYSERRGWRQSLDDVIM